MKAMRKASFVRLLALITVLALVAAACDSSGTDTDETTATSGTEETAPPATDDTTGDTMTDTTDGTTESTDAPTTGGDLETYSMGYFGDITTDNLWNYLDSAGSSVWNAYILGPTSGALYATQAPGLEVVPDLAAAELEQPTAEGDVWVVDVPIKEDASWSDGETVKASDFVFTWNTAVDFGLTANWQDLTDPEFVQGLEAVDEKTLRITFSQQPGLAVWGLGTGVHNMTVMPEHFWGDIVADAAGSDDPAATLLAASGAGAPAAGPTIFVDYEAGSFGAAQANTSYHNLGESIESGGVSYTDGPIATNMNFTFYGSQDSAVLALANGEVDLLLNPLGMQRGLREQVQGNEDLTAIVNPVNGYRFLAFNHQRAPMSDAAFRDALAAVIDKEFVAQSVLQGVATPIYTIRPVGNIAWYDEGIAAEIAEQSLAGADTETRRQEAIRLLTEAGYTWEEAPGYDDPSTEDVVEREPTQAEGWTFVIGTGINNPDGSPMEQLELINPTPAYDPLRSAFGSYISAVAIELGIPLVSVPTEFNTIIDIVFEPAAEGDEFLYTLNWDLFILGYSLGSPQFPTELGSFFSSQGGNNNTGYSNEEFDGLVADFEAAPTQEEAYDILWELERLIARDKPHVPLFETGILEFYNNRVSYPFTETLSGLQYINGAQNLVAAS